MNKFLTYHYFRFPYNLSKPNGDRIKVRINKNDLSWIKQEWKNIKLIEDDFPNKDTYLIHDGHEGNYLIKGLVSAWANYYDSERLCSLFEFAKMIEKQSKM